MKLLSEHLIYFLFIFEESDVDTELCSVVNALRLWFSPKTDLNDVKTLQNLVDNLNLKLEHDESSSLKSQVVASWCIRGFVVLICYSLSFDSNEKLSPTVPTGKISHVRGRPRWSSAALAATSSSSSSSRPSKPPTATPLPSQSTTPCATPWRARWTSAPPSARASL